MQLASAPAWSQSESDDETSGPEATEESEDVAAASSDSPPPPPRSPTDYRASEEISEDLSVSFPVDI
ncbi:MAG: hypothetical protein AAF699_06970 [Pseudomonadota bacterium]